MDSTIKNHPIVSRQQWLEERKALLAEEKALTRQRDEVVRKRRALPWVKIEKEYIFDAPEGKASLSDLFDGRSQLFIKNFMLAPGQVTQCVGCSFTVDHVDGILVHLRNHDVSYVAVARAPIDEIETLRQRMGWQFPWVSSYHTDFNHDFNVSFTRQEIESGTAYYNYAYTNPGIEDLSGHSVFLKDEAGQIFHTYSNYGRGSEELIAAYGYLDMTPKGRVENGPYHSMGDWVRPHNMYGMGGMVEANGRYHRPDCTCEAHLAAT
jgi:predicted dithiol-disulfide oxidoreductase (DUF899 family)